MRSVADGLLGVIPGKDYRLEIWKMSAPKLAVSSETWIYITKISHNGEIGDHSIGLPVSDVTKLMELLEEEIGMLASEL